MAAAKFYLEITGGIFLIIFGILFYLYLPINFSEVTTIIIFIGAGVLIIRKAILNRREQQQHQIGNDPYKKDQKTANKKSSTKRIS